MPKETMDSQANGRRNTDDGVGGVALREGFYEAVLLVAEVKVEFPTTQCVLKIQCNSMDGPYQLRNDPTG